MKDTVPLRQLGALISQQINPRDLPQEAWAGIIGSALQHGLAPMLMWVTRQSAPDIITEPLWTPVIMATRSAGMRYIALESTRKQVNAALDAAHIPSLWLKGITLAHTVYPQPVLRPMGDLDVLVPYEQREKALQVVESLGYRFYESDSHLLRSTEALLNSITHHYQLRSNTFDSVVLELHFRLLGGFEELMPLEKQTWFWSQTMLIADASNFMSLQAEAHLLYLIAHLSLQHDEADSSLRQYFDLHQLIKNSPVDWDKVIEWAGKLGWSDAVERALTRSVQYFSTPVPTSVFAQLRENRSSDMSGKLSARFQGRGSRWYRISNRLMMLLFKERIALIFRLLIPSKPYMRTRYRLSSNRFVYLFYLYRWFDVIREIAWAIWNDRKK